jgi:hypothetical protein
MWGATRKPMWGATRQSNLPPIFLSSKTAMSNNESPSRAPAKQDSMSTSSTNQALPAADLRVLPPAVTFDTPEEAPEDISDSTGFENDRKEATSGPEIFARPAQFL